MIPADIERYELLRFVDPEKIEIGDYITSQLGLIYPNGLIFINSNDPLEEQVKTVLHEMFHMHPEVIAYTGGLWQGTIERNSEYEETIEALAQQTYAERKDIVQLISSILDQARTRSLNRGHPGKSFKP